jgi:dihydroorotate dehydrogenase
MLLKVSPDLADEELDGMASVLNAARIDGVIVSNTTVDRSELAGHPLAAEPGGLSFRVNLNEGSMIQNAEKFIERLGAVF